MNCILLNQNTISVFTTVVAGALACFYSVLRLGFDSEIPYMVIRTLGLSWFLLLLPFVWNIIRNKLLSVKDSQWYHSNAFVTILGLSLLVFLGYLSPWSKIQFGIILSLLGAVVFLINIYYFFTNNSNKTCCIFLGAAFLFSMAVSGIVWGSGYLNPLFTERMIIDGGKNDVLFHSALASIIGTYGIPSFGLDGLPYMPYHYGSHWIFAHVAKLLGISAMTFYQLGYPIIFIPLFLGHLLRLVLDISQYIEPSSRENRLIDKTNLWFLFYLAMIGFLFKRLMDRSAINWYNIFISESYCLGLTLAFIFGSLIIHMLKKFENSKTRLGISEKVFFIVILPLILVIIGLAKISVLAVIVAVLVYFYLRKRLYINLTYNITLLIVLITAAMIYKIGLNPGNGGSFEFFHFIKNYIANRTVFVAMFLVFHHFWSLLYIGLRLHEVDYRWAVFKDQLKSGHLPDVELILVLVVTGLLPGMFLNIVGGSAYYFSDIQNWVSFSLLLARVLSNEKSISFNLELSLSGFIKARGWRKLLSSIILLSFVFNFVSLSKEALVQNIKLRVDLINAGNRGADISEINKMNVLFSSNNEKIFSNKKPIDVTRVIQSEIPILAWQPQHIVSQNPKYKLIATLNAFSHNSIDDKRKTLLYIPKSNTLYWKELCPNVPLAAPAISGIAMLEGVPETIPYGLFKTLLNNDSKFQYDTAEVIKKAQAKGFEKVIIISQQGEDTQTNLVSTY